MNDFITYLKCKILGHKPIQEKLLVDLDSFTTYSAKCKRCNCNLFIKEFIGEHSGKKLKVWIKHPVTR